MVHPAAGHETGTLVNALIAHCGASLSGIGGVKRPGIVHRLDKDTTGLMVAAKNDRAHQIADRAIRRPWPHRRDAARLSWRSSGACRTASAAPSTRRSTGIPTPAKKWRCARAAARPSPIGRSRRPFSGRDGKPVASLLACQLETGRTHQIRVHLAHIGHPLLGDAVYGPHFKTKASHLGPQGQAALTALGRQALHAYLLALEHPRTGEFLHWESRFAGGFASPAKRPASGAMTQAFRKSDCYDNRL